MALATSPPGRILADSNSTLEPRTGNSCSGMSVSVALRPTPTTSTLETSICAAGLIGNEWCARDGDRKQPAELKKRWREGLQESSGREYRELGRWFRDK